MLFSLKEFRSVVVCLEVYKYIISDIKKLVKRSKNRNYNSVIGEKVIYDSVKKDSYIYMVYITLKTYIFNNFKSINDLHRRKIKVMKRYYFLLDILMLTEYFMLVVKLIIKVLEKIKINLGLLKYIEDLKVNKKKLDYIFIKKIYSYYLRFYKYMWILNYVKGKKILKDIKMNDNSLEEGLRLSALKEYMFLMNDNWYFNKSYVIESRLLCMRYWCLFVLNEFYMKIQRDLLYKKNVLYTNNVLIKYYMYLNNKFYVSLLDKKKSKEKLIPEYRINKHKSVDKDGLLLKRMELEKEIFNNAQKIENKLSFNYEKEIIWKSKMKSGYISKLREVEYMNMFIENKLILFVRLNKLRSILERRSIYKVIMQWGKRKKKILKYLIYMYICYDIVILMSLLLEVRWVL